MADTLTELTGAGQLSIRDLFAGLGHHLALQSVLDGTNPGRAFADDCARPTVALVISTEGSYLAGEAGNGASIAALAGTVEALRAAGYRSLWLDLDPPSWDAHLPELFAGRPIGRVARRHYVCTTPCEDHGRSVPAGYGVRPLDGALLADPAIRVPAHVHEWIDTNWGSRESFLQLGFAWCALCGPEVVSWCVCDCVSGEACEVGIHTAEAHRRRGLAAATAAAAAEDALRRGHRAVGWHCNEDNLGSWKTAQRAGFVRDTDYVFRCCTL